MTVREYIGARYVPLYMGDWDNTKTYEPLSIVGYQGDSYTSLQYVPTGIEITNEAYWAVTGNYNAQIEEYRRETRNIGNALPITDFDSTDTVKSYIDDIAEVLPISDFDSINTVKSYIDDSISGVNSEIDDIAAVLPISDFDSINTVKKYIDDAVSFDVTKAQVYNTVSEMKADTSLEAGMICHTNGYRVSGDGGGAWYVISDSGTANEMDVIACGDFYANLVVETFITPQMFGAYGDGETNDIAYIQAVFDYCLAKYNTSYEVPVPSVKFVSNHAVNGTINWYSVVKIINDNAITLIQLSSSDIALLNLTGFYNRGYYGYNYQQATQKMNKIHVGPNINLYKADFIDTVFENITGIGLQVDSPGNSDITPGNWNMSINSVVTDFTIGGFKYGLRFKGNRIYCTDFRDMYISSCVYNIYFDQNVNDSYEKMHFQNMIIDHAYACVAFYSYMSNIFENCSFDYSHIMLLCLNENDYNRNQNYFINCHIEGLGEDSKFASMTHRGKLIYSKAPLDSIQHDYYCFENTKIALNSEIVGKSTLQTDRTYVENTYYAKVYFKNCIWSGDNVLSNLYDTAGTYICSVENFATIGDTQNYPFSINNNIFRTVRNDFTSTESAISKAYGIQIQEKSNITIASIGISSDGIRKKQTLKITFTMPSSDTNGHLLVKIPIKQGRLFTVLNATDASCQVYRGVMLNKPDAELYGELKFIQTVKSKQYIVDASRDSDFLKTNAVRKDVYQENADYFETFVMSFDEIEYSASTQTIVIQVFEG